MVTLSRRTKLVSDVTRYCAENDMKLVPMNIVDALDALGAIAAEEPLDSIEYAIKAVKSYGKLMRAAEAILVEKDVEKIHMIAKEAAS
jgi:hypothetical protein